MGPNTEKPSPSPDPKAPEAGSDERNYFWLETTTEDTEPDKPTKNALVTEFQYGQEHHCPNKTTPELQATRDAAVKVLNGWRKGMRGPPTTRTLRPLPP